ncbi:MAG: hypothetical protein WKF84_13755 [Pyrinomonadaceae bacterium]
MISCRLGIPPYRPFHLRVGDIGEVASGSRSVSASPGRRQAGSRDLTQSGKVAHVRPELIFHLLKRRRALSATVRGCGFDGFCVRARRREACGPDPPGT